jgi:hypothetical protein
MVDINISHYRTMADLEHGRHFTALPTPYAVGLADTEMERGLVLGPEVGFVSTNENARIGLLEFTGQGLEALEKGAQSKEYLMAVLGARLLMGDPKRTEAAETAAIHRAGEDSILASIANAIDAIATEMYLAFISYFTGTPMDDDDVSVTVNTDFVPIQISPQMITALLQALREGKIAHSDFIYALQQGEVVNPDRTAEIIREEVELTGTGTTGGAF